MFPVCIVLVCGVPGSGKSTLIKYIIENQEVLLKTTKSESFKIPYNQFISAVETSCQNSRLDEKKSKIFVISYDVLCELPNQMKMIFLTDEWRNYRKDVLEAAEYYICDVCGIKNGTLSLSSGASALYDSLKNICMVNKEEYKNHVFLIEDNFYYHSMRYEWFQIAKKYGLGFCQVYIESKIDIAIQRNNDRELRVPDSAIILMSTKFEIPDPLRNKWEKYSIVLPNNKDIEFNNVMKIMMLIEAALQNPVEPLLDFSELKKKAQIQCSTNVIHQLDKILRRLTGKFIVLETKTKSKEDIKYISSQINHVRQQMLLELKQGTLCLPQSIINAIKTDNIENVHSELQDHLGSVLTNKLKNL